MSQVKDIKSIPGGWFHMGWARMGYFGNRWEYKGSEHIDKSRGKSKKIRKNTKNGY